MPRSLLALFLVAAAPVAVAQVGLGGGVIVGSGGADGGPAESYIAATGSAAVTAGRLLLTADVELGAASRRTGGSYSLDTDAGYDPLNPLDPYPTTCRNLDTGQARPRSLCEDTRGVASLAADASLWVPGVRGLSVGAGYRAGFQPTPYLTAGYTVGPGPVAGLRFEGVMSQRMMGLSASALFGL